MLHTLFYSIIIKYASNFGQEAISKSIWLAMECPLWWILPKVVVLCAIKASLNTCINVKHMVVNINAFNNLTTIVLTRKKKKVCKINVEKTKWSNSNTITTQTAIIYHLLKTVNTLKASGGEYMTMFCRYLSVIK